MTLTQRIIFVIRQRIRIFLTQLRHQPIYLEDELLPQPCPQPHPPMPHIAKRPDDYDPSRYTVYYAIGQTEPYAYIPKFHEPLYGYLD